MALKKLPYRKIAPLVRDYLSADDDSTLALIRDLRGVRARGYLTRSELEQVCRWKSARALKHINSNRSARVRAVTRRAFATRSERMRLEALLELQGVSIPMASAILMLVDPKRYGVIDIRVWQVLHAIGVVTKKPTGVGFTFANWYQFLVILRYFSKKLGVKARDIERALFVAHKAFQKGRLYRRKPGASEAQLPR
jgi:hypothetical protein